jgi:hypothetical protein
MTLPWPQIFDAAIGVIDLVRSRRIRTMSAQQQQVAGETSDAGMASVIAATVREELERDRLRLMRERAEIEEAERQRAELERRLELERQAGDREIGRLRLLAGVAAAGWFGTLLLVTLHGHAMSVGARVVLGFGWILLLAALAASFAGQANVANALAAIARGEARATRRGISSGISGILTVWLIVAGFVFTSLALLLA